MTGSSRLSRWWSGWASRSRPAGRDRAGATSTAARRRRAPRPTSSDVDDDRATAQAKRGVRLVRIGAFDNAGLRHRSRRATAAA